MGRFNIHSWWALVFSFWRELGKGGSCFMFFFLIQSLPPTINLSQKWWPTILEIKNTCIQWVGWNMHSRCFDFFSFKFWVEGMGGGFFFILSLFPTCSLYVTFKFQVKFPLGSQSPPLPTYIGGPKGEALHLSIESFILVGSLHSLNFFFNGPIKIAHWKKKVGLVRHPQLININHIMSHTKGQ